MTGWSGVDIYSEVGEAAVPHGRLSVMKREPGRIGSVNVVHEVTYLHLRDTAIDKRPVDGPVHVGALGLTGDTQCDTRHHGGPDKAVYAYAREDNDWWAHALGRDIPPGTFGENLTTEGLEVTHAVIGERWRLGDNAGPLLQLTMPRTPCTNLSARMGIKRFHARFDATGMVGAYLRVLEPGAVRVGDTVTVERQPGHGVTVADVCAGRDPEVMQRLLDAELDLADVLRDIAERVVARTAADHRTRATRPSSHTGSGASYTDPSAP